ncbi:MAG: DNA repair protein RecO [Oscillospiraceae bacterium]|nr:DNA repair protein RecO [Oscillospiraceae bacterium]
MFYTTKGLILREVQYKDNDKLLSVLTEELGLITAKARGVKNKNSKLRSGCQLLCYSELTLFEKNGYYTVNEAEPIEMFVGLRTDLELLSLGAYFAQLLETVSAEDRVNPELLSLGLNSLYALETLKLPQHQVKAVFELRLLSLAGYEPQLDGCGCCGDSGARKLYFQQGVLFCDSCRIMNGTGECQTVSDGVLAAMQYILHCGKKRLFSFTLPEQQMKELGEVTERLLLNQLEQSFSTLIFYKRLFTDSF